MSHITSGYINNSPSKRLVRVNEAFEGVGGADGVLNGTSASSVFNYANVTKEGLVDNTLITYGSDPTKPAIWRGYVNSNFPIIERDILVEGSAVFGGLVHRQLVQGYAAAVSYPFAFRCRYRVHANGAYFSGTSCTKVPYR